MGQNKDNLIPAGGIKTVMKNLSLTVVVLTLNEERHLKRCLDSVKALSPEIVVVDSCSSDRTVEIAKQFGARVYVNPFVNYATQFNWALDHGQIKTQWVMRLDADEILFPESIPVLEKELCDPWDGVNGFQLRLRRYFLGKRLQYGTISQRRLTRIWRLGYGRCEVRWMDEHMQIDGMVADIDVDIADWNLNNITWWTSKHNQYSVREAIDLLMNEQNKKQLSANSGVLSWQAQVGRWVKLHFYSRLPLSFRALGYFIYRYFIRLGFLDGWPGLVFHVLQGFWYRFLVDVKVWEIKNIMKLNGKSLSEVVLSEYGYDILAISHQAVETVPNKGGNK